MTTLVHAPSSPKTPHTPLRSGTGTARERWSWAIYDFANTIFSMNVATLYFAVWLVSDLGASNTSVAIGNGVASALVMLSIPILGAISDVTQRRKPWVVGFTLLSVLATIAIGVVGYTLVPHIGDSLITSLATSLTTSSTSLTTSATPLSGYHIHGLPLVAIVLAFIVANYAYQGALPFYNAMMTDLAPPAERGRLSGMGTALGYLGSIAGVLMVTPFFNGALPVFGSLSHRVVETLRHVPFTNLGGRVSTFTPTALLYLLFSLPLIFWCHDRRARKGAPEEHVGRARSKIQWRQAFQEIRHTLRDARQYPGTVRFLIASFVYQDAIGTTITYMALYAVVAMGFAKGAETTLFVVLTIPAVIGSWLSGKLTDRFGPKRMLILITGLWVVALAGMMLVTSQGAFWIVGAFVGFIYGGVHVAERPMLLRLVPDEQAGRFFGLMVLSARAAAIVGPLIWGLTVDGLTPVVGTSIAYRAAVGTIALAMAIACAVLWTVPEPQITKAA